MERNYLKTNKIMFDILKNSLENYRKEQEINNLTPLAPLETKVKEWLKIDYKE